MSVAESFQKLTEQLGRRGHKLYKPYQEDGVTWMLSRELSETVPGGILADEMGLGKTIQTIALLLGNSVRRTLILVPPSLIGQWENAFQTFAPSLKLWIWYGKTRIWKKEDLTKLENIDVVISTYGLTYQRNTGNKTPLHDIIWDRIVLDEGHIISRSYTKRYKGVKSLVSNKRWVLTGTPIQNSIHDIYNLLYFVGVPEEDLTEDSLDRYYLRRTKKDLVQFNNELRLPELEVNIVPVNFASEEERGFYRRIQGDVSDALEKLQNFNFNMTQVLELLMRLRQTSVHPQMVINAYRKKEPLLELPNWIGKTSKIALLTEMIKTHPDESSLIFCNFKYEMTKIQESLINIGIDVKMINGSTSHEDKKKILADANKQSEYSRSLMLINGFSGLPKLTHDVCLNIMKYLPNSAIICQVQSGGTGLNLQKYSRVYFTTLLWNPALESQCIARAHRLGQKKKVVVTKFALHDTADSKTIDERILEIQQAKRKIMSKCLKDESLENNGIEQTSVKVKLSLDDILGLLQ